MASLKQVLYTCLRRAPNALFNLVNLPFRDRYKTFLGALIDKTRHGETSRHRRNALVAVRLLYLRRLFLNNIEEQRFVLKIVSDMVQDPHVDMRECASFTLSTLISRTPLPTTQPTITELSELYAKQLKARKSRNRAKNPGTDSQIKEEERLNASERYAAVMGLASLVEA